MTAETNIMNDVPLLPLPTPNGDYTNPYDGDDLENYTRANVAHALVVKQAEHEREIAAKDAEIADLMECNRSLMDALNVAELSNESLRAEVAGLTFDMSCLRQQYDERTACMIVHRGAALACSDAVRAAYYEEHERAERRAEVLQWYAEQVEGCRKIGSIGEPFRKELDRDGGKRARAALHPTAA